MQNVPPPRPTAPVVRDHRWRSVRAATVAAGVLEDRAEINAERARLGQPLQTVWPTEGQIRARRRAERKRLARYMRKQEGIARAQAKRRAEVAP